MSSKLSQYTFDIYRDTPTKTLQTDRHPLKSASLMKFQNWLICLLAGDEVIRILAQ